MPRFHLLLCLGVCWLFASHAQEAKLPPAQQQLYENILDSLINPCPAENATVLHSNPTCEHANRIRGQVRKMLVDGMSKQEIMDAMVGEYGRDVLALPSAGGFGLAAWITPALVLLVAGAFIVMRLRLWKQQSAHAPVPHSTADVVHRRIEEELSELRNP